MGHEGDQVVFLCMEAMGEGVAQSQKSVKEDSSPGQRQEVLEPRKEMRAPGWTGVSRNGKLPGALWVGSEGVFIRIHAPCMWT